MERVQHRAAMRVIQNWAKAKEEHVTIPYEMLPQHGNLPIYRLSQKSRITQLSIKKKWLERYVAPFFPNSTLSCIVSYLHIIRSEREKKIIKWKSNLKNRNKWTSEWCATSRHLVFIFFIKPTEKQKSTLNSAFGFQNEVQHGILNLESYSLVWGNHN